MQQNGKQSQIVARVLIEIDEQGNVHKNTFVKGFMLLAIAALETQKTQLVAQQIAFEQAMAAQMQAQKKQVLMPDGTLPPPGLFANPLDEGT